MTKQAAKKKEPETLPTNNTDHVYGINKDQIFVLALQDKGPTEIGEILGCTKGYISHVLKPFKDEIKAYVAFKNNPQALWGFREYQALSAINSDGIKKLNARDQFTVAGIARDKLNMFEGRMPIEQDNLVFNVVYNDNRQVNVMQPDNKETPQDVVVVPNGDE